MQRFELIPEFLCLHQCSSDGVLSHIMTEIILMCLLQLISRVLVEKWQKDTTEWSLSIHDKFTTILKSKIKNQT